ncbi:MAG TPA: NAD(P)/FAD-dependent oxidoreductase [Acetobacteraceae bacterium]|nr:NAD(P)/FAD-dependent oxidoreductase [Acetobacteraceae bacterium]
MDQAVHAGGAIASAAPRRRETLRIGIMGAGFGGIGLALLLRKAGFSAITLLERADRVGGTWRDNTYPGAACDVRSHAYSLSFAPRTDWTERYAGHAEILAYIEEVTQRGGVMPHVRLNSTVMRARFDGSDQTWRVETTDGATHVFDVFVSAVGQLSKPAIPSFPGLGDFDGAYFHSAQWEHGVQLAGKRVALIGSAASAVQILPEIAKLCAHVDVFQRTPSWIVPRNNGRYSAWRKFLFRHLPGYRWALRQYLYLYGEFLFDAFRTGSWRNGLLRRSALRHLNAQIQDPVLRERMVPAYELGCKRVLFSDDYYPCFNLPHVRLVTDPISGFERDGIRTADGTLHTAEIAVFATGFDVRHCLQGVEIRGAGDTKLQDVWADGPFAYRGVAVAGFPNMFILYGPNTNLGHNSILVMLECQSRYIVQCLKRIVAGDLGTLDVTRAAMDLYNERLQRELKGMVWSTGCGSWYESGNRITANWSRSTLEYGRQMKHVAFADFIERPRQYGGLNAVEASVD